MFAGSHFLGGAGIDRLAEGKPAWIKWPAVIGGGFLSHYVLDSVACYHAMTAQTWENAVPVSPVANGELDNEGWIEWAHGIWLGIHETDTLQYSRARSADDEKHICPLQLGTIERCIKLYSNPGETVLTPFGGIGSEAYMALKLKRKAVLIELKPEYYAVAVANLKAATAANQDLFSLMPNGS